MVKVGSDEGTVVKGWNEEGQRREKSRTQGEAESGEGGDGRRRKRAMRFLMCFRALDAHE